MTDSAAARIAEALRAVMKAQSLNGADLADRIEQLTGDRPSPTWVSRRVGTSECRPPLLVVHSDLFLVARALEIDRAHLIDLVVLALFGESEPGDRREHVVTYAGCEATVQEWTADQIPARPNEADYDDLPVLDPAIFREPT